jgi:hypothetical protein
MVGPSRIVQESPARPRFGEITRTERARRPVAENQNLPSGFQTSASPTKSRVADSVKGKGKAPDLGKRGPFNVQYDSGPPLASLPAGGARTTPSQTVQYDDYGTMAQDDEFMAESYADVPPQEDVEMIDGTQDPHPQIPAPVDDGIEDVEPHRWVMDVSPRHPLYPGYM